jgi:Leucine-rich repeat (LRR) protein
MEEYDDLEQGPNEDGSFNLSYNDWHIIPYDLCEEYRDRLIYLNLSNNNLVEITAQIGNLSLLKELNLSHNKLKTIDVALGQCIRLRKLDLSYNELLSIPVEVILQCKLLVRSLQLKT